jgi:inward rectifier potassium channel
MVTTDSKIEETSHADRAYATRLRTRQGRRIRPVILGQDGSQWRDVYHSILTAPWWQFILGLAAIYLFVNALFAAIFLLSPGGIATARPGSFVDAFFFSVQTFGSIGYGLLAPKTTFVNVVVVFESFSSLLYLAIATGLIFARFSRPFARVIFSNVAVITPFDGMPTLMLRTANQRANQIFDAAATVSLARQVTTPEGIVMRRFVELKLVRPRTPLFSLSWTIMHAIDETSPLYGVSPDAMCEGDMEILVLLSGQDETFGQVIYSRHSYASDDILFDRRFVDVLNLAESGRMEVNLRRFHDTEAS